MQPARLVPRAHRFPRRRARPRWRRCRAIPAGGLRRAASTCASRTIFTIDGEDAQGLRRRDRASRELGGGRVEVGVHIADVAHYVRPGTALDAEALARATSVYLPTRSCRCCPRSSRTTCARWSSGRDRLAYSVIMVFDAKGKRVEARVAKSVIQSVKRNTYERRPGAARREGHAARRARSQPPAEPLAAASSAGRPCSRQLRDARGSMRMQARRAEVRVRRAGTRCAAIVDYAALLLDGADRGDRAGREPGGGGPVPRARPADDLPRAPREGSRGDRGRRARCSPSTASACPKKERLTGARHRPHDPRRAQASRTPTR